MKIRFAKPTFSKDMPEILGAVLKQRQLTNGGKVAAFEQAFSDYVGGGAAVAVSSCMSALHLSMIDLGVGPGDEVIVPALTHVATAHAVSLTGARAVPADISRETGNLDPVAVRPTPVTKAIIAVHYLGRLCNMSELTSFHSLDPYNAMPEFIPVVEDCALALGSWAANHDRPRHVGLLSRNGCFSFYPCKHITTGEGGMILTSHGDLACRMKRRRSFGIDPNHGTVEMFGTNARMTEFQAAVGLEQIKQAPAWLQRRQENYACLARHLDGMEIVQSMPGSAYALSVILHKNVDRDRVVRTLGQKQIEVSTYYRHALTQHPVYKDSGSCPVAEAMARQVITLPVGPHLGPEHMCHQSNVLKELLR